MEKAIYRKLSKKEKKIIEKKIVERIKKRKWILGAYLFGSFVTRNYFRDIDILIIPKRKVPEKFLEGLAWEIEKEIGIEVDIKDFNRVSPKIRFFAMAYGRPVFMEKKNKLTLIKREVISRYLDLRKLYDYHYRRLVG